jgi:hypothetical protein
MRRDRLIREIQSVSYHRNGMAGARFYRVAFTEAQTGERLIAVVSDTADFVAVIHATNPESRWRPDDFAGELREAIERHAAEAMTEDHS